jgi:hypothetical protein
MELFEARFNKTNPVTVAHHDTAKRWNGEELKEGEELVMLCEQGIGDMVQFLRYGYKFKPEQIKNRAERNAARARLMKKVLEVGLD